MCFRGSFNFGLLKCFIYGLDGLSFHVLIQSFLRIAMGGWFHYVVYDSDSGLMKVKGQVFVFTRSTLNTRVQNLRCTVGIGVSCSGGAGTQI